MQNLLRKFDLFIFDWDGTLRTSFLLQRLSTLFKFRYNIEYVKKHREEFNPKIAIKKLGIEEEENRLYAIGYDLYSIVSKPKLREGARELLERLNSKGKKVAIFSDSRQYRMLKELRQLGITKYFSMTLSADTINIYKPIPAGIRLVAKQLRTSRNRCIYIGDMASDILTAKFAGVASCGIAGGVDLYSRLRSAEPDYLFESLEQFYRSIS